MNSQLLRGLLSATILLFVVGAVQAADRPNIVVMIADDLGWGDVGFHGSRIETPNIDHLAKRGTQLNQFYVQPVCSPTRGAFLTGRYPMRLGLQCGVVRPWAKHGLSLDERTLPQALREAGYSTAICGKWHLGHFQPEYLPTRRGFDLQYGHYNGALDYFTHIRDGGFDWHRNDQPNYDEGYSTDLIGRAAVQIIAEHDQVKPLFLYVPLNAPHTPLQAPQEWLQKYAHFKQKNRQTYAAMVACMDAAVGQIVGALDEHHFPAERTLIFFCSDNGGIRKLGSNRELRDGKGSLYEGGVRVPAVAVWPGHVKAGAIVDEPLHIVDLYPTLLNLAGGTTEGSKPLDGRDAWPTISQAKPSPHDSILLNVTPFHGALRAGDWKLIHNGHVGANVTSASDKETWELFNIKADISEEHDLSTEKPEILARLKQQLAALAAQAAKPNIPPNQPPADFQVPAIWGQAVVPADGKPSR
ncbi:sulfatase-like hydrolase/transferase [bacterium]|nr:sulfatase-like hydrolase/transferase [bacterium]